MGTRLFFCFEAKVYWTLDLFQDILHSGGNKFAPGVAPLFNGFLVQSLLEGSGMFGTVVSLFGRGSPVQWLPRSTTAGQCQSQAALCPSSIAAGLFIGSLLDRYWKAQACSAVYLSDRC